MQESSKTNNKEDLPGQERRTPSRRTTTSSISEVDKTPIAVGGGIELGISSVIVQFNAKFVVCGFFGSAKIVRVFVAARSPHRFHVFLFIVPQQEQEEEEEALEQEEARQQVAGRAAGGTGDVLLSEMFL